jgi:hypothetical protein
MIRKCHTCGKIYEYPSEDPNNPTGLRRCADCMKKSPKELEWKCTCGKVFSCRNDFYKHRREMRNAGTPCKNLIWFEPTGKCPFCGQPIGMSKNKIETHRECIVNHRCAGVIDAESKGITLRCVMEYLRKLKYNNALKQLVISVEEERFLQLSWIQTILEKHGIIENVMLNDSKAFIDQYVYSFPMKTIFVFDGRISEKSKEMFKCLKWHLIELKWTDCILNTDVEEQKVIEQITKFKGETYESNNFGTV